MKIKNYDQELKVTRQQVAHFKHKFKNLTDFIKKKGGIDMLNSLPNSAEHILSRANGQRNEFEDYIGFVINRGNNVDASVLG